MAGQKKVELYKDAEGKFRYRVKAANGRIVGISEQGFARRYYARRRAEQAHSNLPIVNA